MNPLKKLLIITASACLALSLCWTVIFALDYNSCVSLERPRFVVPAGDTADDGGSGLYRGLGYTVRLEVHIDADYPSPVVDKVEMYMFGKIIAASVT